MLISATDNACLPRKDQLFLTRFYKIAIKGTTYMAAHKKAIGLLIVKHFELHMDLALYKIIIIIIIIYQQSTYNCNLSLQDIYEGGLVIVNKYNTRSVLA